mmetsp:Transcript_10/g.23  ORF Transcript_10/g.23 Transcript_10/m.23 type:complete len:97 (-) Transcript_10:1989-2279(-)
MANHNKETFSPDHLDPESLEDNLERVAHWARTNDSDFKCSGSGEQPLSGLNPLFQIERVKTFDFIAVALDCNPDSVSRFVGQWRQRPVRNSPGDAT